MGKDGPGTLTIAQANGFTGGIVVSNGLLVATA
jgi:autotransporter-associated beta strand protein